MTDNFRFRHLPPIVKRFPLARAGEAQKLAERGADGKVLLLG